MYFGFFAKWGIHKGKEGIFMKKYIVVLSSIIIIVLNIWLINRFCSGYIGNVVCNNCATTLFNIKEGSYCEHCGISLTSGNIGVSVENYCTECKKGNCKGYYCKSCGSKIQSLYVDTDYEYSALLYGSQFSGMSTMDFWGVFLICDIVVVGLIVYFIVKS